MKNIAFCTTDLKSGGSEHVAARLTHLLKNKYNVFYIVFDSDDQSYDIDATLIDINAKPTDFKLKKVYNTFKRANGLRKAVKEHNIDILFTFVTGANRILKYAHLPCKTVGSCRGFEDLMLNTAEYKRMIKSGADILFNSREMMEYYLDRYPEDKEHCITIENLIGVDDIKNMSNEPLDDEQSSFFEAHKVITTVGILSKHKGQWDLLKAFEIVKERIPDAGLCIVGHRGLLEQNIYDMVKRNKYADDILMAGYQSNPYKYVSRSDVYALSSISEGFPNALIEAMACGTPTVATACSTGPCEIMYNEYKHAEPKNEYIIADNGILTPCFDGKIDYDYSNKQTVHEIYADALCRIISDRELADTLVKNGYERAKRNDTPNIANEYFSLIKDRI